MKYFVTLLALAIGSVALADELSVKPGQWETTATTSNSMMPGETTNTSTVCVEESTYDPKDMLDGVEHCQMKSSSVTGNTLKFAMQCVMQGANADVSGQYTLMSDSGEGDMLIKMKAGPMDMNVNMAWTSTYLGDC